MEKDKKRKLLAELLTGRISPEDFKKKAKSPNVITCILDKVYKIKEEIQPDDLAKVEIDEVLHLMTYRAYEELVEANPYAAAVPPLVFVSRNPE